MPQAKERAMIFDLSTPLPSTLLSLVAIVARGRRGRPVQPVGTGVLGAGVPGDRIATSVTGFGFPFNGLLPSHIVGDCTLDPGGVVYADGQQSLRGFGGGSTPPAWCSISICSCSWVLPRHS
jgi:hypothetical protein